MARLKRKRDTNNFYVFHAFKRDVRWIPVTYQTTPQAEDVLEREGIREGDKIPDALFQTLRDTQLIYTGGSGTDDHSEVPDDSTARESTSPDEHGATLARPWECLELLFAFSDPVHSALRQLAQIRSLGASNVILLERAVVDFRALSKGECQYGYEIEMTWDSENHDPEIHEWHNFRFDSSTIEIRSGASAIYSNGEMEHSTGHRYELDESMTFDDVFELAASNDLDNWAYDFVTSARSGWNFSIQVYFDKPPQ